jgi:hypothetical protein
LRWKDGKYPRDGVKLFEGALVSASSLGLASFFGSIISHFRSYQIQQHHVRITETTSHQKPNKDNAEIIPEPTEVTKTDAYAIQMLYPWKG